MKVRNLFINMSDEELKSIYVDYMQWLDDGNIPQETKLWDVKNAYRNMYAEGAIHIMELQYLRECAKRFCINHGEISL